MGQTGSEPGSKHDWAMVKTPLNERVRVKYVGSSQFKELKTLPGAENISHKKVDGKGREAILLPDQCVLYKMYVRGDGLLFASEEDFRRALDGDKYFAFGIEFAPGRNEILEYYFHTKLGVTKDLLARGGQVELPELEKPNAVVIRWEDGTHMLLGLPHKDLGRWFPNRKMLDRFCHAIYDTPFEEGPVQSIRKRLLLDAEGNYVEILRLSESAFEELRPQVQRSRKVKELGDLVSYQFKDGRVALQRDGHYVVFDDRASFEAGIVSFRGSGSSKAFLLDVELMSNFSKNKELFRDQLVQFLDLKVLDWSFSDMERLGEQINAYYASPLLRDLIFIPTINYLGEVHRMESGNGSWRIVPKPGRNGKLLEPVYIPKPQREVPLFKQVFQELRDQENTFKSCVECSIYAIEVR